ncbi:MAG TPA: hypothetical protein DCG54_02265 [Anaerolineae bacterium]|nr:hypothetical protein [Anaerolineae bacterium]
MCQPSRTYNGLGINPDSALKLLLRANGYHEADLQFDAHAPIVIQITNWGIKKLRVNCTATSSFLYKKERRSFYARLSFLVSLYLEN